LADRFRFFEEEDLLLDEPLLDCLLEVDFVVALLLLTVPLGLVVMTGMAAAFSAFSFSMM
jgi:hypothetical protein